MFKILKSCFSSIKLTDNQTIKNSIRFIFPFLSKNHFVLTKSDEMLNSYLLSLYELEMFDEICRTECVEKKRTIKLPKNDLTAGKRSLIKQPSVIPLTLKRRTTQKILSLRSVELNYCSLSFLNCFTFFEQKKTSTATIVLYKSIFVSPPAIVTKIIVSVGIL